MPSPAQILDRLAVQLLGVVPENEEVLLANSHGSPIAHDLRSVAGKAYNAMARRLLGEEVPFEPLGEVRRGLFGRRRSGG
jgi:septum site-determining protein MinD